MNTYDVVALLVLIAFVPSAYFARRWDLAQRKAAGK